MEKENLAIRISGVKKEYRLGSIGEELCRQIFSLGLQERGQRRSKCKNWAG